MKMEIRALFIEGSRSGYTPMQCGETLTAGQLINILEDFPPDMPIYLINDNGYTLRTYNNGSSDDTIRKSTKKEKEILTNIIFGDFVAMYQ